jgi:ParB-like chromosome segregation protein Spo0J
MTNKPSSEPIPSPTIIADFPLDSIQPNLSNPRLITEENEQALKSSLDRFGLVGVLVVNERKDGMRVLVSGHQRLKVLLARGDKTGPVMLTKLSIHDETALGLQLNGHQGRFKEDALLAQLKELSEAGRNVAALGLQQDAIYKKAMADLGELLVIEDEEVEPPEEVAPLSPTVRVTLGQYCFEITRSLFDQLTMEAQVAGLSVTAHAAQKVGLP